jgi:type II secretory pathway component PulF
MKSISDKVLYWFFERLALYLQEKISVKIALEGLSSSFGEGAIEKNGANLAQSILKNISEGELFSKSLLNSISKKDYFICGILEGAECGGNLEEGVKIVRDYLGMEIAWKEQMKRLLAYPALLGGFALLVLWILLRVTIPELSHLVHSLAPTENLPLWWNLMNALSMFVCGPWIGSGVTIAAILMIWLILADKNSLKEKVGRLIWKLPGFSLVYKQMLRVITLATLSTMIKSYLSLAQMVELLEKSSFSELRELSGVLKALAEEGKGISWLWLYEPKKTKFSSEMFSPEGSVLMKQAESSGRILNGLEILLEMEKKRLDLYMNKLQFWLPIFLLMTVGFIIGGTILGLMSLLSNAVIL